MKLCKNWMKLLKTNLSMDNLNDLIQVYQDALGNDVCDFLISLFEEIKDKHDIINNEQSSFTQLNLTKYRDLTPDISNIHNRIIKNIVEYRDRYYEYIDKRVFPKQHAFEMFRIEKYDSSQSDYYDTHVDVMDYSSARRFLCFMWYLNDVDEGGQSVFKDLVVEPKRGKLVIYPSLWMYPHRDEPPLNSSKYIMTSYLHYK